MKEQFLMRKKAIGEEFLKADLTNDLYSNIAIFRIVNGVDVDEAEKNILFTATWYEHEHPLGRDPRGEPDFVSISLISALHHCYNIISQDCRDAIDNFFLKKDFRSMHPSENHYLLFRVSRLLAAEFYNTNFFEQYGLSASEIIEEDTKYIDEFLMYRARTSWGEFDSSMYAGEIMMVLNVLYSYTQNQRLKKKAAMMMDIILLDMIVDSKNGLYGGAHGRIYPPQALDSTDSSMYQFYCYYFGREDLPQRSLFKTSVLLSDYYPSDIVCKVVKNRKFPYENRERKHLHLPIAWGQKIKYNMLEAVKDCSIDKYTYVCDDYILGSVNHQDSYPDAVGDNAWYAHHEQHEWELTLKGNGKQKIFSHHPGDSKEHNRWTGDIRCNCGTHFCTKDTAFSLYNIVKENSLPYINAYIPFEFFDKKSFEQNYIFLKHDNLYIMVWFANDYRIITEGVLNTETFEVISNGRKNAFICHVDKEEKYSSFEEFISKVKSMPIEFNPEEMRIEFNNICVDYNTRYVNGEEQLFPYKKLFDSPYLSSEYYSAIFEATDGNDSFIYDFNF